jgi:hypothetical protein
MRRLLIFVLLGPGLLWLAFGLLVIKPGDLAYYGQMVIVFYVAGAIPMLALAGVDELLTRTQAHRIVKAVVCAVIGCAFAAGVFYLLARDFRAQWEFVEDIALLGLFGGIPAAVCSWLSNENKTAGLSEEKRI